MRSNALILPLDLFQHVWIFVLWGSVWSQAQVQILFLYVLIALLWTSYPYLFSHVKKRDNNNNPYFIRLLWGLIILYTTSSFEQCLVQNECPINVSYHYGFLQVIFRFIKEIKRYLLRKFSLFAWAHGLSPIHAPTGIQPATQEYALTRNRTSNLLVHGTMLYPTEPHSQGSPVSLLIPAFSLTF